MDGLSNRRNFPFLDPISSNSWQNYHGMTFPNHCCGTMGSCENQWFNEKLIFFSIFTVEICLKIFRTPYGFGYKSWTDFHFVKRTDLPIHRTTKSVLNSSLHLSKPRHYKLNSYFILVLKKLKKKLHTHLSIIPISSSLNTGCSSRTLLSLLNLVLFSPGR